ncbi:PEP-CTERM sorting domain-containing protein [Nostoc sp. UCD121]|uniref:PEP-CTERM sorting domain-containing protein n=1 Tax=unclassified Nostoc TaxID=2593658 RepID=UPI0016268FC1|nr:MULTISPECIES: PEP-CTERM sorting domain-containing protein [unclassified Nostoc]MBC1222574.1 PEP-CTERM sorting domain-containing protein [Nostoc sp. UCD120]MBC1277907.1 PEP-CTERM sorting domain-containing protein [Nostoc sp. UCD121]MBC1297512.1 PEP-CTERM sorting domain-containing protein [Nostoc sp. UCD122]
MTILAVRKELLKVCSIAVFSAVAAGTLGIGEAQGLVLTFDDLDATSEFDGNQIPNGYGGLNWDNFYYLTTPTYQVNPSGYQFGTVSSPNVAYNSFGDPATVSSVSIDGGQFDFNSAYLTAAWSNGLNILVEGFSDGITKYATTVTVDTTSPTQFNFDFLDIDSLKFTSSGGIDVGYGGSGTQIVLDNFTYNSKTVPEPTTILGLLTVTSFGIALSRKQKWQQKVTSKV